MMRSPAQLRTLLEQHQENHSVEYYYLVRGHIPNDVLGRAARFLYLNRTCFNGMYRVNQLGYFNVPIGTKGNFINDVNRFEEYAKILQHAQVRTQDFVDTIRGANEGDLLFVDPPYTIAHNQNSFIKYNEKLFSWRDQRRLLNALIRARNRGAMIVETNAYYPALQQMYEKSHFHTYAVNRFSSISGLADRRGIQEEMLISSHPINLQEK